MSTDFLALSWVILNKQNQNSKLKNGEESKDWEMGLDLNATEG